MLFLGTLLHSYIFLFLENQNTNSFTFGVFTNTKYWHQTEAFLRKNKKINNKIFSDKPLVRELYAREVSTEIHQSQ